MKWKKIEQNKQQQQQGNNSKSNLTGENWIDPDIKKNLVEVLKREGKISMLDVHKMNNSLAVRFALSDLYRHDFLYSNIHRVPEPITDKYLYRVFYVTAKFEQHIIENKVID